mgnify:FL=1
MNYNSVTISVAGFRTTLPFNKILDNILRNAQNTRVIKYKLWLCKWFHEFTHVIDISELHDTYSKPAGEIKLIVKHVNANSTDRYPDTRTKNVNRDAIYKQLIR